MLKKRYLTPAEPDYKVGGYQGNKIPLMVIIMWLMFIVLAVTYTIVDVTANTINISHMIMTMSGILFP